MAYLRNTSMVTLDASLSEVFQECETVPPVKPPGHTQWCHDYNEGNNTTVNEHGRSCITEDDPEMSRLATPVIFGCLVLFYIGHLAVLMMNIAEGGIGGLKRCSVCSMNAGANDVDMRCHQCMGDRSETDENDENDYCNDSSYKSDPDDFEYSHNNETDCDDISLGANVDDLFSVSDDEIISTYGEENVKGVSDDEKYTLSDGDYDSYDTLNDECDDENCLGSSDKDTNSWQQSRRAKDADVCCHQCMGDCSETGEYDENYYCNDSSYKSDPGYFEYSHNNETDNADTSLGANVI